VHLIYSYSKNILSNVLSKFNCILIIVVFFVAYGTIAQEYLKSGTVEEQFNSMLDKSETYKQFKVIPRSDLKKFRNNFRDTLSQRKADYLKSNGTIATQQTEIEQLKIELNSTQEDLQKTKNEKDSIMFLGMPMSKLTYKALMWSLLGLSLAALLFFIYRFRTSNQATFDIRKQLSETQLAFDAYKKRALDKEQKISRMLQDELNKSNKNK